MIQIRIKDREWALEAWKRINANLDGPKHFGPDFNLEKPPGEAWWEIVRDDVSIGMTWVRRFTKGGEVMNCGRALFPEIRGKHLNEGLRPYINEAIWAAYPAARTVIVIVYSTNPYTLNWVKTTAPEIGVIPTGDSTMHIFLVGERS